MNYSKLCPNILNILTQLKYGPNSSKENAALSSSGPPTSHQPTSFLCISCELLHQDSETTQRFRNYTKTPAQNKKCKISNYYFMKAYVSATYQINTLWRHMYLYLCSDLYFCWLLLQDSVLGNNVGHATQHWCIQWQRVQYNCKFLTRVIYILLLQRYEEKKLYFRQK